MPIHPVDKPLGLSSHDVVARARRLLGTRRVGHAGTLDPLATGVLIVLSHEATKLSQFLTASDKSYLAWIAFGIATPTLDAEPGQEGEYAYALAGQSAAQAGSNLKALTAEAVESAAKGFITMTSQTPPAYSAIKREGQRAYAAARSGAELELAPRAVAYRSVELLAFAARRSELPTFVVPHGSGFTVSTNRTPTALDLSLPAPIADLPTALMHLKVGAGTYIRSFARDLGAALGLPAHLAGLVRTEASGVSLADCAPLDEIAQREPLDAVSSLPFPIVHLTATEAEAVRHGKKTALASRGAVTPQGTVALLDDEKNLAAIVAIEGAQLSFLRVWQRGETP